MVFVMMRTTTQAATGIKETAANQVENQNNSAIASPANAWTALTSQQATPVSRLQSLAVVQRITKGTDFAMTITTMPDALGMVVTVAVLQVKSSNLIFATRRLDASA